MEFEANRRRRLQGFSMGAALESIAGNTPTARSATRTHGRAAPGRGRCALALVIGLSVFATGCSWLHFGESDDNTYDYRKSKPRQEPLEVPPDLSQLPKDERFALPSASTAGTAGASSAGGAKPAPAAVAGPAANPAPVAAVAAGDATGIAPAGLQVAPATPGARIVRDGSQRWLAVDASPEVAYATIKDLWVSMGLKIQVDEPLIGLLQTNWTEIRPKVDEDSLRNGLHKLLGAFDSNGERNMYTARIERTPRNTADITITHRGMVEVYTSRQQDNTVWQYRPSDPELEAEMLQRVAERFAPAPPLRVAVADSVAAPAGAAPAAAAVPAVPTTDITPPSRVHKVTAGGQVTLQVEDGLDNTWRRVGIALDRGGFTIAERHRDRNVYAVRYLDPDYEASEREKRSWWDRVFNSDAKVPEQQFLIAVRANGPSTSVEVQDKDGHPDASPTALRIIDQLAEQLR